MTNTEVAVLAARAMDDKQAHDIVVLDVGPTITLTDYFVMGSAANDRQVRAIVGAVEERLLAAGRKPRGREGTTEAQWVLLDYGDVVVHVFLDAVREFYQLERLWSDAPRLAWDDSAAAIKG